MDARLNRSALGLSGARQRQSVTELSALAQLAQSCAVAPDTLTLENLCDLGVRFARNGLRTSRGELEQLTPRALRSLEARLQLRLRTATAPALQLYAEAARNASRAFGSDAGAKLKCREFFAAFPALSALWLSLISDWRDSVAEFLRHLTTDRSAIERTFCDGRSAGRVLNLRAGLSDPHCGGRTVIEARFRGYALIYKPRAGDGEQAWFDCLSCMNPRGFTPRFRTLRVLRRKDHCWMELAKPAPCRSPAAVRRFYQRLGGMIALATRCGAIDCHRDNLIAAGEHPFLVDAETMLQTAGRGDESVPRIWRTGFLPLPADAPGAEYHASALSSVPGPHVPTYGGKRCNPADYADELASGFRLAQSILSGSAEARKAFKRRLVAMEKLRWRTILRPTAIYVERCEESIQPAALRSVSKRNAIIRRGCIRPEVSASVLRREMAAISRLDVPYFTCRMKAPPPGESDPTVMRRALDVPHSFWR